jgi:hypothetical protein
VRDIDQEEDRMMHVRVHLNKLLLKTLFLVLVKARNMRNMMTLRYLITVI